MNVEKNNKFINKARKVHGDKYDYTKVDYIGSKSKVCIICPIHGEFYQIPSTHLNGCGCKECGKITQIIKQSSDTPTFIERAKVVHDNKYVYSKVEYITNRKKVCIICPIHGEFWQVAISHLSGIGCKKCGNVIISDKKKCDTPTFIAKARKIHGDKYDYSKVEYVDSISKVCIICPIHGEFHQKPSIHLNGHGCKECGILANSEKRSSNTNDFIEKCRIVHGDKYDYSKVEYVNNTTKICIICPSHGEYYQIPNSHLSGNGCNRCVITENSEKQSSDTPTFINKAKKIHGEKYDYSKVEYTNNSTKICIICPIHGEFEQSPNGHLHGYGCKECGNITKNNKNSSDTITFIEKSKVVHGDKYDYCKVEYVNNSTKVCIICPIHGEFEQQPNNHLGGGGCKECGRMIMIDKQSSDTTTWISRAKVAHGDRYDYSKVEYVNNTSKVCIICPTHGEFYQIPYNHDRGGGCPKCTCTTSKHETEIGDYIDSLGLEVIRTDRKILSGLELDLYIPSKNIAIEYNGLYWHSEEQGKNKNYHLNKTLRCKEKGIDLIHIFEDEYLEHKDIVLNKLKHILKMQENYNNVMGRKCNIEVIDNETAMSFLNTYHIQGYGASTVHLGAVHGNELIAVMSLKKESKECLKWELTRFASNSAYICQGIGGKLFKHFIKTYNPSEVKSFADRRWTLNEEDNLYIKLNFELDKTLPPEYRYVVGSKRVHKFNFRKNILHKKYGVPLIMTEKEMTAELGFSRIWDCGLFKYVWKNK